VAGVVAPGETTQRVEEEIYTKRSRKGNGKYHLVDQSDVWLIEVRKAAYTPQMNQPGNSL